MCLRKLILNQAGFPDVTTDELKKIVFCHFTAENAAVCVTKVGLSTRFNFQYEDQGGERN